MLLVLRAVFVLALAVTAITFVAGDEAEAPGMSTFTHHSDLFLIACLGFALVVIAIDIFIPQKSLAAISGVFFGMIVGMVAAYGIALIVDLAVQSLSSSFPQLRTAIFADMPVEDQTPVPDPNHPGRTKVITTRISRPEIVGYRDHPFVSTLKLMIGVTCVYLCVSFILQTKDDVRFVIPYVEFAKQTKGATPLLLDSSVIIDGRIADIAETHFIESELLVPRFILQELQTVADSADKLKRNRGRRGLDMLNKLQSCSAVEIRILDVKADRGDADRSVDERLLDLGAQVNGRVVTNDYNLNKIARLRGVQVININDMANALKQIYLPGEALTVKIIRPGEESGQGVGYLEDGTMVVVEGGREHLGEAVPITVTSVLQTSAGRMIFGRMEGQPEDRSAQRRRSWRAAT